jgi:hypothetical protein
LGGEAYTVKVHIANKFTCTSLLNPFGASTWISHSLFLVVDGTCRLSINSRW